MKNERIYIRISLIYICTYLYSNTKIDTSFKNAFTHEPTESTQPSIDIETFSIRK